METQYRLLNVGETIIEGDEILDSDQRWYKYTCKTDVVCNGILRRSIAPLTWRFTKTDPPKEEDYLDREVLVCDSLDRVITHNDVSIWKYWMPIPKAELPKEPDAFEVWWKINELYGVDKDIAQIAFEAGKQSVNNND